MLSGLLVFTWGPVDSSSLAGWWQMYSAGTDGSWAIDPCVCTAVWTVVDEHDEELWTIQHDPSST